MDPEANAALPAQRQVKGETKRARTLRAKSTDAERKLWSILRSRRLGGHKFVRQLPIGPYFADFACREEALVIEVDGGQHNGARRDEIHTALMNAEGYAVLRLWNNEVLANPQGSFAAITLVLEGYPSPEWRYSPATHSPEGLGLRGERAARASFVSDIKKRAQSVPLPVGERLGEGSLEKDAK